MIKLGIQWYHLRPVCPPGIYETTNQTRATTWTYCIDSIHKFTSYLCYCSHEQVWRLIYVIKVEGLPGHMLRLVWGWQTGDPLQSRGWGWVKRGRWRWREASPCSAGGPGDCRDPTEMRSWTGWRHCPGRTRGRTFWGWSWAWGGGRLQVQSRSCPRRDWSWIQWFAASLSS